MTPDRDVIVLDHMARVGFERMFEEQWTSLRPGSIERILWHDIATAMLREARRWHELPAAPWERNRHAS